MHIAVATDPTYLPWCATTVLSALRATPGSHDVHLLHERTLTPADVRNFTSMAEGEGATATVHEIPAESVESLPSKGSHMGGRASWLRVTLPERLSDVRRILYLDADTFVRDRLDELADLDLGPCVAAAVQNVVEPSMRGHLASLGLRHDRYFNAGVLVLDLEGLRAMGLRDRIQRFVDDHGTTAWFDQDALNVVLAGRWHRLHPRWNAQSSFMLWRTWAEEVIGADEVRDAVADPGILHYEGPSVLKPWHLLATHPSVPSYRSLLAQTPWADTGLEGDSTVNRLIRRLPPPRWLTAYTWAHRTRRLIPARYR